MIEAVALIPVLGFTFGVVEVPLVLYLWGAIWASMRVVKGTEGPTTPVWLAFIWLVPCVGAILALIAVKKNGPTTVQISTEE